MRGDAEIGIQQDAELMAVPGVDIIGPLPPPFGLITSFVFGIHAGARDSGAGEALGQLLRCRYACGDEEQRPDAGVTYFFSSGPNAPFFANSCHLAISDLR